jgi:hypothetical protein
METRRSRFETITPSSRDSAVRDGATVLGSGASRPSDIIIDNACMQVREVHTNLRPVEAQLLNTAVLDCGLRTLDEARRANVAFLQWFVALSRCRGRQELVMLKGPVDRMWHSYILHTKLYRSICDQYLGVFLEHRPQPGFPSDVRIQETVTRLSISFGSDLSPLLAAWSPTALKRVSIALGERARPIDPPPGAPEY